MSLHATLSPSSAERWLSCPASIRMTEEVAVEQEESVYAREGTAAHALAEMYARDRYLEDGYATEQRILDWRAEYDVSDEAFAEMDEHAVAYTEYLGMRMAELPHCTLLLEQRLPTGVPDSWGTSDAVIVSPVFLEIVDLKYGLGVRVEAQGNPQLRLYAVGALEAFGDLLGVVETVRCTVFQPRLDHVDSEELPAEELRAWRDNVVIPRAELALGPDAPFGPSEEACRWCPASGHCKAQMEYATQLDFGVEPEWLDEVELADALARAPFIRKWLDAVENYCLDRVYSKNQPMPGWKVVISGGKRSVVNHEETIRILVELGFQEDQVSVRKAKGVGDLEKLVGKDKFEEVLMEPGYVRKGDGSPSLVPVDDKREAVGPETSAQEDFI